jgi:transcriptional regulator with XRE-family HTH domain
MGQPDWLSRRARLASASHQNRAELLTQYATVVRLATNNRILANSVIAAHDGLMYGKVLRQLREMTGRTQAEVARKIGMSPAQLARLEMDQRGLSVEDFVRIAEELGEKAGNLLPNDLGDLAYLKPLIDRLVMVPPDLLPRVAAIVENVVELSEERAAARPPLLDAPPAASGEVVRSTRQRRGASRNGSSSAR